MMTSIDLTLLTQLKEINKKLVSGYHISEQDQTLWLELTEHAEAYQSLFTALGHQLHQDSRGFFYLEQEDSTPNMGKISRGFALTLYVLIEYLSNQGKDPVQALFQQDFDLEWMQTLVQNYKGLFEQLDISSGSELRKDVFNRMLRYGLARESEQGFRILAPAYRYLDALMEVDTDEENAPSDSQNMEEQP